MATYLTRVFILLIFTAAAETAVADATFQCGGKIVEIGMTQSQVLARCAEPTSRTVEQQAVRNGNRVVGYSPRSRWTYKSFSRTGVLVFDGEKLTAIE